MLDECIIVNEGLRVKLYPDKVMKDKFNRSLGNVRFVWNNLLTEYQKTFELFKQHGYTRLKCNQTTFNTMLTMLKKQYPFLYKSESSSLQQIYRDLLHAFNGFFKKNSNYPRFKSKKNPKNGFRIGESTSVILTFLATESGEKIIVADICGDNIEENDLVFANATISVADNGNNYNSTDKHKSAAKTMPAAGNPLALLALAVFTIVPFYRRD